MIGIKSYKSGTLEKMWKVDVICLQKTKLEVFSISIVKILWACQRVDYLYLGSIGASGGILLLWDCRVVEK